MDTILFNAIISVAISIITAYFTSKATYDFKEKEDRKNCIIKKNYTIYKKLLKELENFFTEPDITHDVYGFQSKKKRKDINKRLKVNFTEYRRKQTQEGISCEYNRMEAYQQYIKKFEKLFSEDIEEISQLSPLKIKKIATKIKDIYTQAKKEECLFEQSLREELANVIISDDEKYLHFNEEGYSDFKKGVYWGECWLKILPLLKKLKRNLEIAVNLKGIEK